MIDEILTSFYEECSSKPPFRFGQLFYVATQQPPEQLKLWRPVGYKNDEAKSYAVEFGVMSPGEDAFQRKYPLSQPLPLATNEEFVVVKYKPRPAVLLVPEIPLDEPQQKGKGKVSRRLCLVAPVFSLSFAVSDEEKFSQELITKIRRLEYPQFMFLPKHKQLLKVDSLLRLDECQSVCAYTLQPLGVSLNEPVRGLLRSQFSMLVTGLYDGDYQVYRDCIREGLAD